MYALVKFGQMRRAAGPTFVGPGDVVSGATAWWGTRAYNAAKIGSNIIRLRRSSDNAEQDFAAQANGGLDAAAITSFKGGSTNVFVVTLYDQVGSNNLSGSAQPIFTISDSEIGGKPSMFFSAGLGTELVSTTGPTIAQPFTTSSVFIDDDASAVGGSFPVLFRSGATHTPIHFVRASSIPRFTVGSDAANINSTKYVNGQWVAAQGIFNNTSSSVYVSGNVDSGSIATTDGVAANVRIAWNGFTGRMTEFGIYPSALNSTQQGLLNTNQHVYFGAFADLDVTDTDALAWLAALPANGGGTSRTRLNLIEDLIVGLKADGVWTKLDRLWIFAAEWSGNALVDLKARALATAVNSPTFTADQGYQGNGSSSYVDTNFPPNTGTNFLQDSAHIGAWDLTSRTTAATKALVGVEGASTNRIEPRTTSGSGTQFSVNAVSQASVANADAQGAYIVSRTGSTTTDVYKNGSAIITGATNASAARTNIDFYVLANNSGGTAGSFSDDQCAAFWLGGGLNSTEAGNLYTRLQTYLIAVGAITDDADVNTWVGRAKANGGTVSKSRQTLVYNLITGLKSDGVWSKLDRLWLLAAENAGSALVDLVAGAIATLTNAPTFTTDIGYTAASTKFINTGFDPTAATDYVLNSATAAVWAVDNVQSGSASAIGASGLNLELWVRFTDDKAYWRINDGTLRSPASTDASGLWHMSRTANNATALYRNGSSVDSASTLSTSIGSSATIKLLGDGSGTWTPNRMACAAFGSGMNSTEATAFYNRLRTYMTAVGVP